MMNSEAESYLPLDGVNSGCSCKIDAARLREILDNTTLELPPFPGLLVGHESADDAAVLRWHDGKALVSSLDFFMPMVKDPLVFGKIAAANAVSDIYAMGGKPLLALAILGWPSKKLPSKLASQILDGARMVCAAAGVPLAGGHSIETTEVLFGLSVCGEVEERRMIRNNTVEEGDVLILTKPIGSGIISTAVKRGVADASHEDEWIAWMCALNNVGQSISDIAGVHAMTDITGFGFLGHLSEMLSGSDFGAEIHYDSIPMMRGAKQYAAQMIYPDLTTKNFQAVSSLTSPLSAEQMLTLCDPQTSGGLLISSSKDTAEVLLSTLRAHQMNASSIVGRVIRNGAYKMQIG
jgi:selenide,water dikinase